MKRLHVPNEWDLSSNRRYKLQNMERAMRGKIERGLVELITNCDDKYRELEEEGAKVSGKIRVEIERRKRPHSCKVIIRDRASGMSGEDLYNKLGELGRRTSGFEEGRQRRGLHGRGARDVAAFGAVHFESIKNNEYNHLTIPLSLKCRFANPSSQKATQEIRKKVGISKGNGTVVTIEVHSRFKVPLHDTLLKDFSRYYSLRDIFSNPKREVKIVDSNQSREDLLIYNYPEGETVFDQELMVPRYPEAKTHLLLRKHETSFEQDTLPTREGILVKSGASIHDCTYFGLESEPLSWRFSGELSCNFIDKLVRDYDDYEEDNPDNPDYPIDNPIRLLDPFRDGLILEHPFAQSLYKHCKEILRPFIDELKESEHPHKRKVTDKDLDKRLEDLSKVIGKVFEKKLTELEEEILTEDVDNPKIQKLGIGLHIIPPNEHPIILNQPKTFSVIVKHFEELDESVPVNLSSSDPNNVRIHSSRLSLKKFSKDKTIGRTTFTAEGTQVNTEAYIEARYSGYEDVVLLRVIGQPLPRDIPEGLTFEKPLYNLRINEEKKLTLWLRTDAHVNDTIISKVTSDHLGIVLKGGGHCKLHQTDSSGVFKGNVTTLGRQLKARGIVTAQLTRFEPAHTEVRVGERVPTSGINFKPPNPVEDDFGSVRYQWDHNEPYLLLIGAKNPSIRRYLGEPNEEDIYPYVNSPLYHAVLAEVIAEALAFQILQKRFKKDGQEGMLDYTSTDAYFHRDFSEFLTVTHEYLVNVQHEMS